MLIRFRVRNFLSFKDEVELSMIPGKTRQHPGHIISGGESRHAIDVLRSAVVYGANASGKSNLVKAMDFARDLILEGTKARQSLQMRPFKLNRESLQSSSKFEFEIRTQGKDYLYGFEANSSQIISEWLYEIKLTTQDLLFERETTGKGKVKVKFPDAMFQTREDKDFFNFVALGTRPNQLFLTESMEKNIKLYEPVFNWFSDCLTIIFPETRFGISEKSSQDITQFIYYLEEFDTGICGVELHSAPTKKYPAELQRQILEILNRDSDNNSDDNIRSVTAVGPRGERIIFSLDNSGELISQDLVFRHRMGDCQDEVAFDADEESDGSIRLLDLIPVLYLGASKEKVFVIDELDRSLHPHLCYKLLDFFFQQENKNTQIIVTTHESNLLSFDLLRRDEIWFVEKDLQGATSIYSLEEFTPRYDKDIQKGYLQGRFGAIPIVGKKHF